MVALQNILTTWERYSSEKDIKNPFVFKWCESLLLISDIYKNDQSFMADVIVAATEYFDDKLSEQEKRDAFFYILGICTRK